MNLFTDLFGCYCNFSRALISRTLTCTKRGGGTKFLAALKHHVLLVSTHRYALYSSIEFHDILRIWNGLGNTAAETFNAVLTKKQQQKQKRSKQLSQFMRLPYFCESPSAPKFRAKNEQPHSQSVTFSDLTCDGVFHFTHQGSVQAHGSQEGSPVACL